jgi:REP element-mobilizing transposase RayT
MARPLRIEYEGAVYHVTSRGNARQDIFIDDLDRTAFLEIIADTVERFSWLCHAYCLMTNHYHLLIETPHANLSRGMQHLNGVYTQRFNRRHGRVGHVMQGRFKSVLVEKESHLLELARYVVLNPVRAKIVRSVHHWPWSSYNATAGHKSAPSLLTTEWILAQFAENLREATSRYRRFVKQGRGVDVWQRLRSGVLMGSERFIEQVAPLLHEMEKQTEIHRQERLAGRPSLEELFSGITGKPSRDRKIYEATRQYEYTLTELQEHLGLHYSTISRIASRVEEQQRSKDKI